MLDMHTDAVLPFLLGTVCGVMIGMLSKGIIIGSYNGCNNKDNGCSNSMSAESVKGLPVNADKKENKK